MIEHDVFEDAPDPAPEPTVKLGAVIERMRARIEQSRAEEHAIVDREHDKALERLANESAEVLACYGHGQQEH